MVELEVLDRRTDGQMNGSQHCLMPLYRGRQHNKISAVRQRSRIASKSIAVTHNFCQLTTAVNVGMKPDRKECRSLTVMEIIVIFEQATGTAVTLLFDILTG